MTVEELSRTSGGVANQFPLSANQDFLCAFDRGDEHGALGRRHIVVYGWRLQGALDLETLQLALNDVVVRHEVLRTSIVRDEGNPHQRVNPPGPVDLTISAIPAAEDEATRDRLAHEFLNEAEGGTCSIGKMPLLRAELGRFDENDAVLVLITHHIVSDGWSMQLIMRDLAAAYATRRGLAVPELPEMRQYGDFALWQQQNLAGEGADRARDYWRGKLIGANFVTIPPDRTRRIDVPAVYSVYRFLIDAELTAATAAFARSMRSSSFMVLYATFNLFLHRRTGASDIVAPTITSGRTEPGFEETVGPFFNFVPVRTDLSDCATFRDLANKTRTTCLEAYSYELAFREVATQANPEVMAPFMDPNGVVSAFQLFQYSVAMEGQLVGDLKYTDLRRRLISHADTSDIPDGNLWALDLDPAGDMVGSVRFNSHDFDEPTIVAMVDEFRELLRTSLAFPDSPLNPS
jgi:condensation enzyme